MDSNILLMIGGPADGQTFALAEPIWLHGVDFMDEEGMRLRYQVHRFRFAETPEMTYAALISPDMDEVEATRRVLSMVHQGKIRAL